MIYFYNFINYFSLYPFKVIFLFIIILQVLVIHRIFKVNLGTKYKIYNHIFNWFWILLYIAVYIGVLFFIRYHTWGQRIDLKKFQVNLQDLYGIGILYPLILLLLYILFITLLYKFKQYLTKEVIKRHLYHYHMSQETGAIRAMKDKRAINSYDTLYIDWLRLFQYGYSYENFRFSSNFYFRSYTFYLRDSKKSFMRFIYKITFGKLDIIYGVSATNRLFDNILRLIPISILITLCLYDLYYNAGVITKIYYYLPFYLLYTIWYNVSHFICNTDSTLNHIICERYYQESEVLYIGTKPEEDEFILEYIRRGFKAYEVDYRYNTSDDFLEKLEQLGQWKITFMNQRRYLRDKTNMQEEYYYNETTEEMLDMKGILANAKEI